MTVEWVSGNGTTLSCSWFEGNARKKEEFEAEALQKPVTPKGAWGSQPRIKGRMEQ